MNTITWMRSTGRRCLPLIVALCLTGCARWTPPPEKKVEANPQGVAAPEKAPLQLRCLPPPPMEALPHQRIPRMVAIPNTDAPPALDGSLSAKCWSRAAVADGFSVVNHIVERAALALQPALKPWEYGPALGLAADQHGHLLPAEPTTVMLNSDRNNLYIAFKCVDSQVVAAVQQTDGPVWMDDCIELFIDPHAAGTQVFHIAINARGAKFDERFQEEAENASARAAATQPSGRKWDCKMSFTTGRSKDGWWAQMAIPFESLGVKPPDYGAMWSVNFARWNAPPISHGGIEMSETATWSPVEVAPSESDSFGRLYFGRTPPAIVERLLPGIPGEGVNVAEVVLRELAGKGVRGRLILSTQTETGDLIETTSQPFALSPNGSEKTPLTYKIPPRAACYLAATILSEKGESVIDSLDMPLELPEEQVSIDLAQDDFIAGYRPIRFVIAVNEGDMSAAAYGLRVEILRERNVLASAVIDRLDSQRVEAVIQNSYLAPGSYMLQAHLLKDGKPVAEAAKDIELLKSPFDR